MRTPVGALTKSETREVARRLGLLTAEKVESQEICFVPDGDYVAVLEQRLPAGAAALSPGPIVTTGGEVLGEHQGFARYTVGQRRGLPGGRSEPLYVVDIRPDTREIVVGSAEELDAWSLTLEEVNWLVEPLGAGETCEVQVRSRAPAVPARVVARDEERVALELLEPARAVAPGQSGVLYREDLVLGGGVVA